MIHSAVLFTIAVVVQGDPISRQKASVEAQVAALAAQQTSVRKQARLPQTARPAFFVTLEDTLPISPPCEPIPLLRRRNLIDRAAQEYGVKPELIEAVMEQESGYRPCAVSAKGAMGLMQLMPATSLKLGVGDAFDPEQNVSGGAKLLKELMQRYSGDLNRVLGAYNAGTVRVDEANGIPAIPETANYVERILSRLVNKN